MLEGLLKKLRVTGIPKESFEDKGYILYQDASLMRLNNEGESSLDRFEESAAINEAWANAKESPVHLGKAAMSRISAAAYLTDIAVFNEISCPQLCPDRVGLEKALKALNEALNVFTDKCSSSGIGEKDRFRLENFRMNAIMHIAEVGGWLGDEIMVKMYLGALEKDTELIFGLGGQSI